MRNVFWTRNFPKLSKNYEFNKGNQTTAVGIEPEEVFQNIIPLVLFSFWEGLAYELINSADGHFSIYIFVLVKDNSESIPDEFFLWLMCCWHLF